MNASPEQIARATIDRQLQASGWMVQSRHEMNISAGLGVAVREFPLSTGFADYVLYGRRHETVIGLLTFGRLHDG